MGGLLFDTPGWPRANKKHPAILWKLDWDPAGVTKYKSGRWQGPPKNNALWKLFKMPRGDPLIRLGPKMLIQFSCFLMFWTVCGGNIFDSKRFHSHMGNTRLLWENRDWDPAGTTKYKSGRWQGPPADMPVRQTDRSHIGPYRIL